jgi:NMD protein affecting ribosome stability and mRNA decay
VQSGFAQTCQDCHGTASWSSASFDHNKTGFPLTGAHVNTPCASCHVNNNYNITDTSCVSCHLKDFQGAANPNHVQAGFPQTCQQCHSTANWNASFDHATTGFPLTGAHTSLQCSQCHVNGNYSLTDASCVSCHLNDYQTAANPNHVQAGFPQTCQQCHSTANWNASFDHSTTGFPLTGAHTNLQCAQCHINGNYSITDTSCVSCHLKDFQGTTDPNHVSAGFPQTCQTCHSTTNWNASFDHSTTGFALTGAHAPLQCAQCHTNGNYSFTSGACAQCHLKDYQGTTDPNHAQAGFPQTCDSCHSTTSWAGATFNHSTTGFPLTGAHASVQCAQCHVNGNYNLTSTACSSCHLKDFQGTTNPNHVTAGFPQTCDLCHNTTAWQPSSFDHSKTTFPLTGAHTTVACASCHVNNNYTTVPTDCYSCHKSDYQTTTNPNHASAGFPTTCATCHTTTTWQGATFNHTWFPTNHGNANGVCANCHTNSSDYSVFQCTQCHGGGNSANFRHPNVGGYVYNSANCYQCHPRGRE